MPGKMTTQQCNKKYCSRTHSGHMVPAGLSCFCMARQNAIVAISIGELACIYNGTEHGVNTHTHTHIYTHIIKNSISYLQNMLINRCLWYIANFMLKWKVCYIYLHRIRVYIYNDMLNLSIFFVIVKGNCFVFYSPLCVYMTWLLVVEGRHCTWLLWCYIYRHRNE